MSDLCVFTTGKNLELLQESCKSVMITLHSYDHGDWKGYVTGKIRSAIQFLQTVPNRYAMWVDGHDTLVLKPERDILARFQTMGGGLVIAAEKNCWPDPERVEEYGKKQQAHFFGTTTPRFLNAGGIIGTRHDLLGAMHTVLRDAQTEDDQREWTRAYLSGVVGVQLDYARTLFSCAGDGIAALKADTCVMHFNGRTPGRKEYWEAYKEFREQKERVERTV